MLGERGKKWELKETKERFAWHHGRSQGGVTMERAAGAPEEAVFAAMTGRPAPGLTGTAPVTTCNDWCGFNKLSNVIAITN